MKCPYCGGVVPPRTKSGGSPKKFCSNSCRNQFWRNQHREQYNFYMKIYRIKHADD